MHNFSITYKRGKLNSRLFKFVEELLNINMKSGKIILITDLIEEKLRKEQELEFYEREMRELLIRMSYVRQEIGLTEIIIRMIELEEIPNILKNIEEYDIPII